MNLQCRMGGVPFAWQNPSGGRRKRVERPTEAWKLGSWDVVAIVGTPCLRCSSCCLAVVEPSWVHRNVCGTLVLLWVVVVGLEKRSGDDYYHP